jgi:hypothetical protein
LAAHVVIKFVGGGDCNGRPRPSVPVAIVPVRDLVALKGVFSQLSFAAIDPSCHELHIAWGVDPIAYFCLLMWSQILKARTSPVECCKGGLALQHVVGVFPSLRVSAMAIPGSLRLLKRKENSF